MHDLKMMDQVTWHESDEPSKSRFVKMQDMKTHDLKLQDLKMTDLNEGLFHVQCHR